MNNNELINRLKVFYNGLDMSLCRSEIDRNKEREQALRELKNDFNRLILSFFGVRRN